MAVNLKLNYWTKDDILIHRLDVENAEFANIPTKTYVYRYATGNMYKATISDINLSLNGVVVDYVLSPKPTKPVSFFHDLQEYGSALIDDPAHPHNSAVFGDRKWFTIEHRDPRYIIRKLFKCTKIDADNEGRVTFTWEFIPEDMW